MERWSSAGGGLGTRSGRQQESEHRQEHVGEGLGGRETMLFTPSEDVKPAVGHEACMPMPARRLRACHSWRQLSGPDVSWDTILGWRR
eukprot:991781-Rhodomonas_salina.1